MSRIPAEDASITPKAPPEATVYLDWRAYFYRFMEAHGGNPVHHNGRLLFHDGWQYSATAYQGPEWPPPEGDELKQLQITYWTLRLNVVKPQADNLRRELQHLHHLQKGLSAPLMQAVQTWVPADGNTPGHYRIDRTEVNLEPVKLRLEFLEQDVKDCEAKLKELRACDRLGTM